MTNQRQFERVDVILPVVLIWGAASIPATTRNASPGGMLLDCAADLPFGTEVKVRVHLPSMKEPSELPATVRWVREGAIGLQFGPLRAKETWALNQLAKPA